MFLKTSEEAKCSVCDVTFTNAVPQIKSAAINFDTSSNKWELQVLGTGFTGDKTTTEFKLNGVDQTLKEVTSTSVKVVFSNLVKDGTIKGSKLYFDIGLP